MKTLYKVDAHKQVRVWSIIAESNVLIIQHGVLNGTQQVVTEVIDTNQSGRTIGQQVTLAMQSRINKQLDKGYCESIEEATSSQGLNASKLLRPMLAQKYKDVKNIDWDSCFVQYKYNGHRLLVTKQNGELIAYSRNGKPINSIGHILKDLEWLPDGYTLDGELYFHGAALQTISSWISKNQPESQKLVYVVYDSILKDGNYGCRLRWLENSEVGKTSPSICPAPTYKFSDSRMTLSDRLEESLANGYEGLILRHGSTGYEAGKRSQSLVKVKKCMDAEFCIVGVHQSKDGWAIFECMSGANTFRVSAMGTIEEKHDIWLKHNDYIGKMLTVEFFEWTIEGKPFHPVAIEVRGAE